MSAAYAYRRAAYTDSSDTDWNELPSVVYTVMWRFPSEWIIDSLKPSGTMYAESILPDATSSFMSFRDS